MADTAVMSAILSDEGVIGGIRETAHQGHVLLYGSGQGQGSDGNHDGNPTGFAGIAGSSEGVDMAAGKSGMVKLKFHMQNSSGGGFRMENERYGAPDDDQYVQASDPIRTYYKSLSITGQLLEAAAKGEASMKRPMQEQIDRMGLSARGDVNQAAWGNGTGVRATLRNNEAAGQTVIDVDTTIYFRGGEIIDGLTIATGVVIEPARKVVSVDRANLTITVTPALTTGLTATTDGWVPASSDSTVAAPNNSWNREINGISKLVAATGTVEGLSPTQYPRWASYVATGVGAISENVLRLAKSTVGFETGLNESGNEFVLITTRGIRDNFSDTLLPSKRFVNTQVLKGGFDQEALMFDNNPIYTDDHCQPGRLVGLRTKKFMWAAPGDWSWMNADGAILSRVPGRERYEAVLYNRMQLLTTERAANFRLEGISDTVR